MMRFYIKLLYTKLFNDELTFEFLWCPELKLKTSVLGRRFSLYKFKEKKLRYQPTEEKTNDQN